MFFDVPTIPRGFWHFKIKLPVPQVLAMSPELRLFVCSSFGLKPRSHDSSSVAWGDRYKHLDIKFMNWLQIRDTICGWLKIKNSPTFRYFCCVPTWNMVYLLEPFPNPNSLHSFICARTSGSGFGSGRTLLSICHSPRLGRGFWRYWNKPIIEPLSWSNSPKTAQTLRKCICTSIVSANIEPSLPGEFLKRRMCCQNELKLRLKSDVSTRDTRAFLKITDEFLTFVFQPSLVVREPHPVLWRVQPGVTNRCWVNHGVLLGTSSLQFAF